MPTFGELTKARLHDELNNDSTQLYTTERRQRAINDAIEEFADLTECLAEEMSVAVSCNTAQYSLVTSTRFVRLAKQGVEYLHTSSNGYTTQLAGDDFPERPIPFQNRVEPGWRASTTPVTTPRAWYQQINGPSLTIGLFEPPKVGSSETATLLVPIVSRPVRMSDTTALPFTVNSTVRTDLYLYHKALPHYAAFKLLPLTGDKAAADAQLQVFLGYVSRYLGNQRPRGGQMVTYATNYLQRARRGNRDVSDTPGWTWR
jgi:hypothetical protein